VPAASQAHAEKTGKLGGGSAQKESQAAELVPASQEQAGTGAGKTLLSAWEVPLAVQILNKRPAQPARTEAPAWAPRRGMLRGALRRPHPRSLLSPRGSGFWSTKGSKFVDAAGRVVSALPAHIPRGAKGALEICLPFAYLLLTLWEPPTPVVKQPQSTPRGSWFWSTKGSKFVDAAGRVVSAHSKGGQGSLSFSIFSLYIPFLVLSVCLWPLQRAVAPPCLPAWSSYTWNIVGSCLPAWDMIGT